MAGMSFQSPHPINGTEPGLKVAQPIPGPLVDEPDAGSPWIFFATRKSDSTPA